MKILKPRRIIAYGLISTMALISCNNSSTTNQDNVDSTSIVQSQVATITPPTSSNSVGRIEHLDLGCGYNYRLESLGMDISTPNFREVEEIKKILSYSGIPLNFEIYQAEIKNAAAVIIEDKRLIIYDKGFLSSVDHSTNSYWSSMSILAHEIGHHLSGHTLINIGSDHSQELEADKFSGFILYKMGASLDQASAAISTMGTETDSKSHPNRYKRLSSIKVGWEEAARLRYEGAIPPPPEDILQTESNFVEFNKEQMWSEEDLEFYHSLDSLQGTDREEEAEGIITEVHLKDSRIEGVDIYSKLEDGKFYSYYYNIKNENLCNACLAGSMQL